MLYIELVDKVHYVSFSRGNAQNQGVAPWFQFLKNHKNMYTCLYTIQTVQKTSSFYYLQIDINMSVAIANIWKLLCSVNIASLDQGAAP